MWKQYLGVTFVGLILVTFAVLYAVLPERELRTRHITKRSEESWVTLTETEHSVTVACSRIKKMICSDKVKRDISPESHFGLK